MCDLIVTGSYHLLCIGEPCEQLLYQAFPDLLI